MTLPALLEKLEKPMTQPERKFWLARIAKDGRVSPAAQSMAMDMLNTERRLSMTPRRVAAIERFITHYRSGKMHLDAQAEKKPAPKWKNQLRGLAGAVTRAHNQ